jgi:dUTP pyrophosphatase
MPTRAHASDAAYDLKAREVNFDWEEYATVSDFSPGVFSLEKGSFEMRPGTRALVKTGVFLGMTPPEFALILPRSGLALKYALTIVNAPGLIDAGYRGELGVILMNLSPRISFHLKLEERVAQLKIMVPYREPKLEIVDELSDTDRGDGGFGSTG